MQEVAELAKECAVADDGEVLTESKASARLGRRVEGLISQVNRAIDAINIDDIPVEESDITVTTEELAEMLKAIAQVTDEEKVQRICSVMDDDQDGNISLDELSKVNILVVMVTHINYICINQGGRAYWCRSCWHTVRTCDANYSFVKERAYC